MRIEGSFTRAKFKSRPNRFLVQVQVDGREEAAHLADPGRLRELLLPGVTLLLKRESGERRKTRYTVFLVRQGDIWVCVDTRMPNKVAREALESAQLAPFAGYDEVRAEVTRGKSRIDFLLTASSRPPCWVEVKSVSLVEGRRALFPDAPTSRGARHVRELTEIVCQGERAAVLFLLQRADADVFSPHEERDPELARALQEAVDQGVEVYAYRSLVSPAEIRLLDAIPVDL